MLRTVSPARWLSLCVLLLAATFLANTLYVRHVAAKIDTTSASVAENSGASVVYLARVTEDIRLVSEHARAGSNPRDRAAVRSWLDDMQRATSAYIATPNYPGEVELYAVVEARRQPFLDAVENLLSSERSDATRDASIRQMNSSADDFARAVDALESAFIGLMADRQDIPTPSKARRSQKTVALPALSIVKVALYEAMREAGIRKADLARRLGWHMPQVDRLLDLRHASRMDQIEAALNALGKELVVDVKSKAA